MFFIGIFANKEIKINKQTEKNWVVVTPNIDFSKEKPIKTSNSLHIYEEIFEINGNTYKLSHVINNENSKPLIEILIQ